ncbi:response regulator, partial [bacterium]|nr:response regulator [bacterium]
MKILIIDDDFINRRLLQKIVRAYGSTDQASDGIDAIAAITMSLEEKDPYDLILLDIAMPTMNGLEVLTTIRELESLNGIPPHKGAKIIMVTASKNP